VGCAHAWGVGLVAAGMAIAAVMAGQAALCHSAVIGWRTWFTSSHTGSDRYGLQGEL
jgi:hypothetical protein